MAINIEDCNLQALLTATILSVLTVHSSIVEKPILNWLKGYTSREKQLLEERHKLKEEQSALNMVNEFAKYSKLQRKINSIDETLKEISSTKKVNSIFIQLGFAYGIKLVLLVLLLFFSLYYRYTPVLNLGNQVNLIPFTRLICYPNEGNYVSFYFWAMCTAAFTRLTQKLYLK